MGVVQPVWFNQCDNELNIELFREQITKMRHAIAFAVRGEFDQAEKALNNVTGFGQMAKLSFYQAVLFLGLGRGEKMQEAAVHSKCHPQSKCFIHLRQRHETFKTPKHGDQLISAMALRLDVLNYVAENILCKNHRYYQRGP